MAYDPSHLFTLRFRLSDGTVTIRAWGGVRSDPYHTRIDVEMRWKPSDSCRVSGKPSQLVFPRGATYCGVSDCCTLDGNDARELVTSLFCMKPGDTDREYFNSYTPEQLEWVTAYGEGLGCAKDDRYCDPETGSVRS